MNLIFRGLLLLLLTLSSVLAGAEQDWQNIVSLDAGPKKKPATAEEARILIRNQYLIQRKALETFLATYPTNAHAFEAEQRLACIWGTEGMMDGDRSRVELALNKLSQLENSSGGTPKERADAGFLYLSIFMQTRNGTATQNRSAIVQAARAFNTRYPGDIRSPRLLVEAATLCDDEAALKMDLLQQALSATHEESLRRRIGDDLKRIGNVGRPFLLKTTAVDRKPVDFDLLRGRVVVLIFWSTESPHCLLWLKDFRTIYEALPTRDVVVVTVSLDKDRENLARFVRTFPPNWITINDGMGWEGTLPRNLGINALPSVWVLDKAGVVRTINAKSTVASWIKELSGR